LTDSGYFALKLFNSQCLCVDGFSAKHDKFFDSHIAHVCLGKNSTIDPYTVFITNTQVKNFKGKVVIGLREAATAEIDKYTSANPPLFPPPIPLHLARMTSSLTHQAVSILMRRKISGLLRAAR
jgi:hypothetical protein